jgi:hypothetical protein
MEGDSTNKSESSGNASGKKRREYVRSQYLFPGYDMEMALKVANKIDTQGAGSLSEASLAMALGLSAKSSGFQLRIATAKQFALIERKGSNFHTTELAKGIFRPVSEAEKKGNLARSFYNIELFRAIGDRFDGVPLPNDTDLRNLLEREFGVKRERVGDAFSTFMKSAKVAGLLQESQGKIYLLRESTGAAVGGGLPPPPPPPSLPPGKGTTPVTATWNISVDTKDLAGMNAEAIKAMMEGLERLAKIVVLEQKGDKEGKKEK